MPKIKVAITQRVLSPYRAPFFEKLAQQEELSIKLLYGSEVKGSKLKSISSGLRFPHHKLFTLTKQVDSSGRTVPLVFHPGLFLQLVKFNPDIILCEGASNVLNNFIVFTFAFLFRKKIIWWSLGQLPNRKYRGLSLLYYSIVKKMERRADAWLTYSTAGENYFLSQGYSAEKVFKAINCVDTDAIFNNIINASSSVESLRDKFDLNGKKVILFVGSITPPKRVDRLIEAFSRLQEFHPDTCLLIVGGGKELNELKYQAERSGAGKKIIFTGEIREGVSAYFQLGDIFVLPGLGGLAIPEAMANGLPVLCGQADGTEKDYVLDGITGYNMPDDSDDGFVDNLTQVLHEILSHPEKISQIGKNAKELIKQKLNINTYIRDITACLRKVNTIS